jgi:hypothetical protein
MGAGLQNCILALMADQLAAPWLPIHGHRIVQTPHLSELARTCMNCSVGCAGDR